MNDAPLRELEAPPRSLGGAILRFLVLVSIAGFGIWLVMATPLRDWLELERAYASLQAIRDHPASPLVLVAAFVVCSVAGAPVTPMVIAGGAVFGALYGSLINYAGTLLGAFSSYWVGRTFGHDLVARLFGSRREKLEKLLEKRSFWALLRLRFVPVPFAVTNYGAALLGVTWRTFWTATAIAYVAVTPVWSYFASAMVSVGEGERSVIVRNLAIAAILMACLTFVPQWIISRRDRAPAEAAE